MINHNKVRYLLIHWIMGHLIYGQNSAGLLGICKIIIHGPSLKCVWNVFSKSKYAHTQVKWQNENGIAIV